MFHRSGRCGGPAAFRPFHGPRRSGHPKDLNSSDQKTAILGPVFGVDRQLICDVRVNPAPLQKIPAAHLSRDSGRKRDCTRKAGRGSLLKMSVAGK